MDVILLILIACAVNGAIAFIGAFSMFLSRKAFDNVLFFFISFSAGVLLSGAFFHLISESIELSGTFETFKFVFFGFTGFFLLEKLFYWHHCHDRECKSHPVGKLILIGDTLHNFIDGVIIATSFLISPELGILTSIMIILHEIPQELGDFAVLVYSGMERKRALVLNFFSQLACFAGAGVGIALAEITSFLSVLLPIAAGGFIYIAASDLIPELHKEREVRKSMLSFLIFIAGVVFIAMLKH